MKDKRFSSLQGSAAGWKELKEAAKGGDHEAEKRLCNYQAQYDAAKETYDTAMAEWRAKRARSSSSAEAVPRGETWFLCLYCKPYWDIFWRIRLT